jgi:cytochrome c biogenesis protein CcdA
VAGIVLVILLFLMAVAVARAQQRVVERLRARSNDVKRWGGWVLLVVGGWFIVLAIWPHFFARLSRLKMEVERWPFSGDWPTG